MPAVKIVPFSAAAVREICSLEPKKALDACSICSCIPPYSYRQKKDDDVEHDDIPGEAERLVFYLDFGPNVGVAHIARCPECDRLYERYSDYDYSPNSPSYETWRLTRCKAEEIARSDYWHDFKQSAELHFDGAAWSVVVDGNRNNRSF